MEVEKKEMFVNVGDVFYCPYGGLLEVHSVNRQTGEVVCQYFDTLKKESEQDRIALMKKTCIL